MLRWVCVAVLALLGASPALAQTQYTIIPFSDLKGWSEDQQDEALTTFTGTCDKMREHDWSVLCALAHEATDGRAFFEMFFLPVLIEDGSSEALFTGYFEPELHGSRTRSARYKYPVYRMPPEARRNRPWLTRRQIETGSAMRGRGLEIAYVDNAVDLFYMQIQGSGRIRLDDGSVIRLGYEGFNGHEYSSLGQRMVRRGILRENEASATNIRAWVAKNPSRGAELMRQTNSYVFFSEQGLGEGDGPLGALSRSLTELRSIAVDRDYTPLGAPVWLEVDGADGFQRLMVAQDVGSAIQGAQRADIFFGYGDEAGRNAWRISHGGRMLVLMPIQRAHFLLPDVLQ